MTSQHLKPEPWAAHTAATDPGPWAGALSAMGPDLGRTVEVIQGLLIHGAALEHYGLSPPATPFDRTTMTVLDRLEAIRALDPRPLSEPRVPAGRSLGTCRDFALLLCSVLRSQGMRARLRCGFAAYFEPGRWEDHWICELLPAGAATWRRVDAQLDDILRPALGISFDVTDVPRSMFLTADEAWRLCRRGDDDPARFGHGAAAGSWFMRVNVVRDHFALSGRETSEWDSWRAAIGAFEALGPEEIAETDRIAGRPEAAIGSEPAPPWLAANGRDRP